MRIFYIMLGIRDWLTGLALCANEHAVAQAEHAYYVHQKMILKLQQMQHGYENDNEKLKEFLAQNRVEV